MSEDHKITERASRVPRALTVRINEDVSAEKLCWDIVMAQNISASGILFNYDHYLEPGTRLRFKITLPACGNVECEGEVVRNVMGTSCSFGGSTQVVCGIAAVFRNIDEQDQQAMLEFFEQRPDAGRMPQNADSSLEGMGDQPKRERRIARPFLTQVRKSGQTDWIAVPVQNISASGILFNYPGLLEVGEGIALRIKFPFLASEAFF